MKILITTDIYTTKTNGVATSVRNLMDELTAKGHEVRVLTFSHKRKSYKEGNVYYLKSLSLDVIYPDIRMPVFGGKYIKELINWQPDVIHSQCEWFSYHFAKKISKKANAPIVHTYHTLYEHYVTYVAPCKRFGAYFIKKFSRARLRGAAAVVAPTAKVEKVLNGYGLKPDIHVIPSGIDMGQHKKRVTELQRQQMRAKYNIPKDAVVMLNLGRLGTEKNLTEVLQNFAVLYNDNPNLWLVIVGDGPAKKGLKEKAKQLKISERTVFTGMVEPTLVHEYFQLGDVFVSSSTSETQGLTYLEAAASALPLLCRRDPCLDGVLLEGQNGWGYDTNEEFLTVINEILADVSICKKRGRQSEIISQNFDKAHFGDRIEKLYKLIIK